LVVIVQADITVSDAIHVLQQIRWDVEEIIEGILDDREVASKSQTPGRIKEESSNDQEVLSST
jgi:Ni,Fe-hydrogenase III large subunit